MNKELLLCKKKKKNGEKGFHSVEVLHALGTKQPPSHL